VTLDWPPGCISLPLLRCQPRLDNTADCSRAIRSVSHSSCTICEESVCSTPRGLERLLAEKYFASLVELRSNSLAI